MIKSVVIYSSSGDDEALLQAVDSWVHEELLDLSIAKLDLGTEKKEETRPRLRELDRPAQS